MSVVQDNPAPAADQKAIDELQPAVAKLTPAGKRKLLSIVARECLTGEVTDVPLTDDEGDVFGYASSLERPVIDFSKGFSKEELRAIRKNLFDPRFLMTVEETIALLEAADDRKDPPRQSAD